VDRLRTKEKLTLAIAVLALFLSVVTLYFQFFYVSNKLEMVVISERLEVRQIGSEYQANVQMELGLVNSGNQNASILEASFCLLIEGEEAYAIKADVPELPLVFAPHDIVALNVSIPIHKGNYPTPVEPHEVRDSPYRYALVATAMDANGRLFTTVRTVFSVSHSDGGWRLKPAAPQLRINLFQGKSR